MEHEHELDEDGAPEVGQVLQHVEEIEVEVELVLLQVVAGALAVEVGHELDEDGALAVQVVLQRAEDAVVGGGADGLDEGGAGL